MIRKCDKCGKCGKNIRFINRKGLKNLIVNSNSVFFIPDDQGDLYVTTTGSMRRGRVAPDGIKGFTLHDCK